MSYYTKYISWKLKYLNLKNQNLTFNQFGGLDSTKSESNNSESKSESNSESNNSESNSQTDDETNTDDENNKINLEQKTDPGRGILGDLMYYFVANTGLDGNVPDSNKSWTYKEPKIESTKPEIVPYTDFNQQLLEVLYNHSRSEYEEGFDIGYIVGYECGCNQDTSADKKNTPGNISNPDFLEGFYNGYNLAYQKGTKYYYTTWIQINNNNNVYKKNLINYVTKEKNIDDENYVDKTNPNYNPIDEKLFNEYYVYLKKKIMR